MNSSLAVSSYGSAPRKFQGTRFVRSRHREPADRASRSCAKAARPSRRSPLEGGLFRYAAHAQVRTWQCALLCACTFEQGDTCKPSELQGVLIGRSITNGHTDPGPSFGVGSQLTSKLRRQRSARLGLFLAPRAVALQVVFGAPSRQHQNFTCQRQHVLRSELAGAAQRAVARTSWGCRDCSTKS